MMKDKCENCGRERGHHNPHKGDKCNASYSYVVYGFYGCDTGCDGYNIILCDKDDNELAREWVFENWYKDESEEEFAKELSNRYWPRIPVDFTKCEIQSGY